MLVMMPTYKVFVPSTRLMSDQGLMSWPPCLMGGNLSTQSFLSAALR
jgi:hypothetical protein